MSRQDEIRAIQYRLDHPEEVPGKSWYTIFRADVQRLLKIIEEIENEQREERSQRRR